MVPTRFPTASAHMPARALSATADINPRAPSAIPSGDWWSPGSATECPASSATTRGSGISIGRFMKICDWRIDLRLIRFEDLLDHSRCASPIYQGREEHFSAIALDHIPPDDLLFQIVRAFHQYIRLDRFDQLDRRVLVE